ncbi:protein translocase subunit SecF [Aquimonas sp.]|jgi:preprotein translocase subunit SecF|uniref:protein translocase subunit SecF n=1 Tax=Aquimonas sp. TaxID=1872588 RepID=UPI0037C1364F
MNLFPYDSRFDFMRLRNVSLIIALALLLVSLAAIPVRGFNFALDFTGGTVAELHFEKSVDVNAARTTLEAAGFEGAQVQSFGASNEVLVQLQPTEGDANAQRTGDVLLKALNSSDNPGTLVRSDFVGPQIGKELATNGVYALLLVVAGFLIYISLRFEWKFAVAATLTTLHDVMLAIAWFAISGHEFDLNVLAGILSVMGYSINDTIVVFDRVRENFRTLRLSPVEVMNRAVNQTMSRTIITSFVALLTVLALYFYGGPSLKGMAESQIIGIVIGTLSSIFIACPLLLWLGASKEDLLPKAQDEAELARRP